MSGAHRMILCSLALLSGSMALTAKAKSPVWAADPVLPKVAATTADSFDFLYGATTAAAAPAAAAAAASANEVAMLHKVTATSGVSAATTTAAPALEKAAPPAEVKPQASTSIVGKAAAAVGTAAVTALSAATGLAAATITCPDGFANAAAGGKCCASQFVKHFNKAKLLCESEPGWKTFEASPESFNCCQVSTAVAASVGSAPDTAPAPAPVKAPVVTQAAVVKTPEVAKSPKGPKTAPTHSPGFNSGAAKASHLGQVHSEVKKLPTAAGYDHAGVEVPGDTLGPGDTVGPPPGAVDPPVDQDIQDMLNAFEGATTMSPKHRDPQRFHFPSQLEQPKGSKDSQHVWQMDYVPPHGDAFSSHHHHHEAHTATVHSPHHPKYDNIVMLTGEHVAKDEVQGAWETWHYMVMAVLIAAVWLNMPGKDMRHVPVPGYGDVDFMGGEKNPEKCDLFGSGYTANSYGGAAMKPPVAMKNPVGEYRFNNFNDDDIGL